MTKQAGIDWSTVAKLFAGGALTGTGIGAATSFMRHLKSLQEQAKQDRGVDSDYDDDVLYLNLPASRLAKKSSSADPSSASTFAVGSLGALLGSYMAYNAVRNRYQQMRKKELQQKLDTAQQVYLTGLGGTKEASQFPTMSKLVGSGYLAALMTTLGSAVVANRILQRQFPPIKSPNRGKPRKVVIRSSEPGETPATASEEVETPESGVTPDAVEAMLRTHMTNKQASAESGFADLVAASAAGRCEEIRQAVFNGGLDTLFDCVKGARFEKASNFRQNLAMTWISVDPLISNAVQPLLAAELYDTSPGLMSKAACIEPKFQADLVGLSEAWVQGMRREFYAPISSHLKPVSFEKRAFAEERLLAQTLQSMLAQPPEEDRKAKGLNVAKSQDSSHAAKNGPSFELEDDAAKAFLAQNGDAIDNALAKV